MAYANLLKLRPLTSILTPGSYAECAIVTMAKINCIPASGACQQVQASTGESSTVLYQPVRLLPVLLVLVSQFWVLGICELSAYPPAIQDKLSGVVTDCPRDICNTRQAEAIQILVLC